MTKLSRYLDWFSNKIGSSVAWLAYAMMILISVVVILRYVFNIGAVALQESVVYLHGMVIMLGIAYTLKHQAHVRVDILYSRMRATTKALIDIGGTLLFLLPLSVFIFLVSLDYVSFSWSLAEGSAEPGGLPGIYLLKTLIPILAALLFLQGISELIKNCCLLINRGVVDVGAGDNRTGNEGTGIQDKSGLNI